MGKDQNRLLNEIFNLRKNNTELIKENTALRKEGLVVFDCTCPLTRTKCCKTQCEFWCESTTVEGLSRDQCVFFNISYHLSQI